jgi:hypothetical protein
VRLFLFRHLPLSCHILPLVFNHHQYQQKDVHGSIVGLTFCCYVDVFYAELTSSYSLLFLLPSSIKTAKISCSLPVYTRSLLPPCQPQPPIHHHLIALFCFSFSASYTKDSLHCHPLQKLSNRPRQYPHKYNRHDDKKLYKPTSPPADMSSSRKVSLSNALSTASSKHFTHTSHSSTLN